MRMLSVALCTLLVALAGCAGPDAATPTIPPTLRQATIRVQHVRVERGESVMVEGTSTLPAGTCLASQLSVDGESAGWWPTERCIAVEEDGTWRVVVMLGQEGRPEALDPQREYLMRVAYEGEVYGIEGGIYFDLAPPPAPPPASESE
jgi:hypothetical protein